MGDREARAGRCRMPRRFGVAKDIQITSDETGYIFANPTRLKKPLRPKTGLRKRNGAPLSRNFIRPQAKVHRVTAMEMKVNVVR